MGTWIPCRIRTILTTGNMIVRAFSRPIFVLAKRARRKGRRPGLLCRVSHTKRRHDLPRCTEGVRAQTGGRVLGPPLRPLVAVSARTPSVPQTSLMERVLQRPATTPRLVSVPRSLPVPPISGVQCPLRSPKPCTCNI